MTTSEIITAITLLIIATNVIWLAVIIVNKYSKKGKGGE